MKLPEHLKERRAELAKVDRKIFKPFEADNMEYSFKNGYDTAYADLMAEVQPLIEALKYASEKDYGDTIRLLDKPTDFALSQAKGLTLNAIQNQTKQAIADWQKKFGGVE